MTTQSDDSDAIGQGGRPVDPAAESSWSASLAHSVAEQIKYWRRARRFSAQQLAARTKELGHHVPRNVIANLENGRRETVGLAELLVLAAALDVAPVLLVAPVGRQQEVEILPDVNMSPWKVRGWLHGVIDPEYRGFSSSAWQTSRRVLVLYDIHRLLIREHQQTEKRILRIAEQNHDVASQLLAHTSRPGRESVAKYLADLAHSLDRIRAHRRIIASEGFKLPQLPPNLAGQLREATQGDPFDEVTEVVMDERLLGLSMDLFGGAGDRRETDDDPK